MNAKSSPEPVDIHVGQRVRQRRILLGLTQTKLGDALNITFQQVQKYERGSNRIGSSRLYKISQILDVPVSFFFDEMPHDISKGEVNLSNEKTGSDEKRIFDNNEILKLASFYYGIENEKVRKQVYNLMKSLSRESE